MTNDSSIPNITNQRERKNTVSDQKDKTARIKDTVKETTDASIYYKTNTSNVTYDSKRSLYVKILTTVCGLLFFVGLAFVTINVTKNRVELRSKAASLERIPCPKLLPVCISDEICTDGLKVLNCTGSTRTDVNGNCCVKE